MENSAHLNHLPPACLPEQALAQPPPWGVGPAPQLGKPAAAVGILRLLTVDGSEMKPCLRFQPLRFRETRIVRIVQNQKETRVDCHYESSERENVRRIGASLNRYYLRYGNYVRNSEDFTNPDYRPTTHESSLFKRVSEDAGRN